MKVEGAAVLITGSNRGLGKALVAAALAAGAAKVYAAARSPAGVEGGDARIVPVALDLTDPASIEALRGVCGDTDILINNAASLANASALRADTLDAARVEMETNYWGVVRIVRSFAPVMARRETSAIVNILSIGALAGIPFCSSYCASKAAAWSFTQALRPELAGQGTGVFAVFPGPIATGMARAHEEAGRTPPADVARAIFTGIAAGSRHIFPDPASLAVAQSFGTDPWSLPNQFAGSID